MGRSWACGGGGHGEEVWRGGGLGEEVGMGRRWHGEEVGMGRRWACGGGGHRVEVGMEIMHGMGRRCGWGGGAWDGIQHGNQERAVDVVITVYKGEEAWRIKRMYDN